MRYMFIFAKHASGYLDIETVQKLSQINWRLNTDGDNEGYWYPRSEVDELIEKVSFGYMTQALLSQNLIDT